MEDTFDLVMLADDDHDDDPDDPDDTDPDTDPNPNLSQIEEMEETFDLVMVAERWDESMVLLKNLLCWDFRSG